MNRLQDRVRLGGRPTETDLTKIGKNSRELVVGCTNLQASESVPGHVSRRIVAIAAGRIFRDHRIIVQPALEIWIRTAGDVHCRLIRICRRRQCCMKAHSEDRNRIEQRLTNRFSMITHKKSILNNTNIHDTPEEPAVNAPMHSQHA